MYSLVTLFIELTNQQNQFMSGPLDSSIKIRSAQDQDIESIHALVVELAIYEKEPNAVTASLEDYKVHFKEGIFSALVAEINDEIVGMALYYMTYSTWKGKMLYLEDFVVKQNSRRKGIGQKLFHGFLEEAKNQGCILTKWQVLDWNEPAVKFYEKIGATIEKNWWNGKLYL